MTELRRRLPWRERVAACLLVLPWITPFAGGPSPTVEPLLLAGGCVLALALVLPMGRVHILPAGLATLLVLALLLGPNDLSVEHLCAIVAIAATVLCAALGTRAFQSEDVVSALVYAWLAAAVLNAVAGLFQYFELTQHLGGWVGAGLEGRATGNLRQPNQMASLCAIGTMALLWLVAHRGLRRWDYPVAVLLALANAATASRIGLLQLIVVTALVICWRQPHRRASLGLCGAALLAYAVAVVALPWLHEVATGQAGYSVSGRLDTALSCGSRRVLWANVIELIAQKPWFGWGWGELDYAHYMHLYGGERFCIILDNAHNLPLHLAVELGLPVALAGCAALAWLVLRPAPWRERDATRQLAWGVLTVILLHSMVEYPLWYGPFLMAFGLCLGLVCPGAPNTANPPAPSPYQIAAALVLLGGIGYAAWDYQRVSQAYLPVESRMPAYQEDTLRKIGDSVLFRNQARFAALSLTPLDRTTAAELHGLAAGLLHYSPEPKVIEILIESAVLLGREQEALEHLARYRAAFPEEYRKWTRGNARWLPPLEEKFRN